MILHSIKWRLQVWHGFLLAFLVSGLMTGFYAYERIVRLQAVDNELADALTVLLPRFAPPHERDFLPPRPNHPPADPRENHLRPPGTFPGPPDGSSLEEITPAPGSVYYIVWAENGRRFAASTNSPSELERPTRPSNTANRTFRTRGNNRELVHFVPTGRCLVVGNDLASFQGQLGSLAASLALIGLTIVVSGLAVGAWLAARALRPIEEISQTAREIAAGDLSRRINSQEAESELGQLATVLNSTFLRLETVFAQQRQFTSDAAHELRTPVSVILTQVQSALNKERTPAEYRETLEACQRAAQRMRRLIESLLELARWDAGQERLSPAPLNLRLVAENSLDLVRALAEEREIPIHAELEDVSCVGDVERLGQVVTNLVANAIVHNSNGGEIRVSTRRENGRAILAVSDKGPGIPPQDLPHIFKRFYRVDKSRHSARGSTGLGLAICDAVVRAHGGSIEVTSQLGHGTRFTVFLPAS